MTREPDARPARTAGIGGGVVAVVGPVVVAVSVAGGDDEPAAAATSPAPTATATTAAPATPGPTPTSTAAPAATSTAAASPTPSASPAPPRVVPTAPPGVVVPVPPDDRTPVVAPPRAAAEVAGVSVTVSVEAVTSQATVPGEVAGPAYALTVVLTNEGTTPYDPTLLQVSLYAGADGVPLATVDTDPRVAVPTAAVRPGTRATATYVYVAPTPEVMPLAAVVDLSPELAPVVHQGLTPR